MQINVVHQRAKDNEVLDAILENIDDGAEHPISEPTSSGDRQLIQIIEGVATSQTAEEGILDIIGHALDGELYIGTWAISESNAATQAIFKILANLHQQLNLSKIRLLGCSTATATRGRALLQGLQQLIDDHGGGITVYGSNTPMHAAFFGQRGLTREAAATYLQTAAQDGGPPAAVALNRWWQSLPLSSAALLRLHGRLAMQRPGGLRSPLRKETADEIRASRVPYGQLIPIKIATAPVPVFSSLSNEPARSAPGLLELPKGELVVPIPGTALYHRISILFDGALVRVYPDRGAVRMPISESVGVTYRVKAEQREFLRELLRSGSELPL